jgi:hypothetical protein
MSQTRIRNFARDVLFMCFSHSFKVENMKQMSDTPYARRLWAGIVDLSGQGERGFTRKMLAQHLGIRTSESFVNRLIEFEQAGLIDARRMLLDNGGVAYVYTRINVQLPLPESDHETA